MAPAAATIDDLWAMDAGSVRSIVLILHGGQATSIKTAGRGRGPYLRMIPFAAALHRRGRAQGLSVRLLLYRYRGWNEPELHPLADARWALDHLGEQRPAVPVALLGHSMGGRTALRVADHPAVVAVCALAPWTPEDEPVHQVTGRSVLIAHGDRDRVTDPRLSYRFAVRARATRPGMPVRRARRRPRHAATPSRLDGDGDPLHRTGPGYIRSRPPHHRRDGSADPRGAHGAAAPPA